MNHNLPIWMGRYPRRGADWTPNEDRALLRAYESGRYLVRELAARHLREPVAINRRLCLWREKLGKLTLRQERTWQTERETAQQAVSQIKGLFAGSMWPDGRSKTPKPLKPGAVVLGKIITGPQYYDEHGFCTAISLTDLPPEVAQALQFGGES